MTRVNTLLQDLHVAATEGDFAAAAAAATSVRETLGMLR
jgi:hypothetical protein